MLFYQLWEKEVSMIAKVASNATVRVVLLAHQESVSDAVKSFLPETTHLTVVSEKYQFIRELIISTPEVVLVEGETPCLEAMEALFLARNTFPEIPFVVLYDPLNSTLAAEALLEGASACLPYSNMNHLFSTIEEVQLQHPSHSLDLRNRRIMAKIKDNIDGLDAIRSFFGTEDLSPKDSYSASVKAEIESSIAYLEKLGDKLRTKAV